LLSLRAEAAVVVEIRQFKYAHLRLLSARAAGRMSQ
jgi:hypothetical protein